MKIRDIEISSGTQHRPINSDIVSHYAERMKAGDIFPPVEVYSVGNRYILTDGFHRLSACIRCQKDDIDAEVKVGTLRDCIFASYGANKTNGLHRLNIRGIVESFYEDPRTGAWQLTQEEIAGIIGCSASYVARIASEIAGCDYNKEEPEPAEKQDLRPPQSEQVEITDVKRPEISNKPDWSASANRLLSLCQNINADIKQIEGLDGVGYEYLIHHRDADISGLRHLIRNLMSYAPLRECPQCGGVHSDICPLCEGNGYITPFQERYLPCGILSELEVAKDITKSMKDN